MTAPRGAGAAGSPRPSRMPRKMRGVLASDRFVAFFLVLTMCLDLALLGAGWAVLNHDGTLSRQNRAAIAASHGDALRACELANASRRSSAVLLREILALPAVSAPQSRRPGAAAARRADLAVIRRGITASFALRDCAALYSGSGKH
jgi:hypothetical protein